MIVNGYALVLTAPIKDMLTEKVRGPVTSHGLSEAGYDIRIKQDIEFRSGFDGPHVHIDGVACPGRFIIASAIDAQVCRYRWSGFTTEYSMLSGCKVEIDGKFVPEDRVRFGE